jgi:glycosyltransferase involved in cell wall biosynthesis
LVDPMRIAFLAHIRSVHARRTARWLAARGHRVDFITAHPGHLEGVHVHSLGHGEDVPSRALSFARLAMRLRALVREIDADVLFVRFATTYGFLAALSGFHPYLLQVTGSDILVRTPLQRFLLQWTARAGVKRADAIAATSRLLADQADRWTAGTRRTHLIPEGVDLRRFEPAATRAEEGYVVGSVKTLKPIYGIEYLIRAFPKVLEEIPEARLLVVGDGPSRRDLEGLAASLLPAGSYEFAGRVPHDDVPGWLARMDVLAMPTLYESFGVSALEASAMELPVVASAAGGIPEAVRDGETGILVPPGNPPALAKALIQLGRNPSLRLQYGRAGRRLVEAHFDWQKNMTAMEDLVQRLARRPSRNA